MFKTILTTLFLLGFLASNTSAATVSGSIILPNHTSGNIYVAALDGPEPYSAVIESTTLTSPGPYTISNLPDGTNYWLHTFWDADGSTTPTRLDHSGSYGNPISDSATGIDITIQTTGFISGTVTDATTGNPLENFEVFADVAGTWDYAGGAGTYPDGTYVLPLAPGTYTVITCPECADPVWPYARQEQTVTVTDLNVSEPVDFALETAFTVSGIVVEEGTNIPIANATVDAQSTSCNGGWVDGTRSGADGTYSFALPVGDYYIRTYAASFGEAPENVFYTDEYHDGSSDCNNVSSLNITADTPDLDFSLTKAGVISGTLYDSNGSPITGYAWDQGYNIGIEVFTGDCDNRLYAGWGAVNENDGTFTTDALPDGEYKLKAVMQGTPFVDEYWAAPDSVVSCETSQTISVSVGNNSSGKNFQLAAARTITGTVSAGSPPVAIAGLMVEAYSSTDEHITGTETDSNGLYTLAIPAGQYKVMACPTCDTSSGPFPYNNEYWEDQTDPADATIVDVSSSSTTGIDFFLAGDVVLVSGKVVEEGTNTPIANARVDVQSTNCYGGLISTTHTGADGTYSLSLAPDAYYIRTYASDFGAVPENIFFIDEYHDGAVDCSTVTSINVISDTPDVDFSLTKGGVISGTLRDSTGTPITGYGWEQGYNIGLGVFTGVCTNRIYVGWGSIDSTSGAFITDALPDGDYTLLTNMQGTLFIDEFWSSPESDVDCENSQTISVSVGNNNAGNDFHLEELKTITGNVSSSNPASKIAGLRIEARAATDEFVAKAVTDSNGDFALNVPAGKYKVLACATCETADGPFYYQNEYWENQTYAGSATIVDVSSSDKSGIDFVMTNGSAPGDINGDNDITLADAVKGLQIVVGGTPSGIVLASADVDTDGRIGVAEVVDVMAFVAQGEPQYSIDGTANLALDVLVIRRLDDIAELISSGELTDPVDRQKTIDNWLGKAIKEQELDPVFAPRGSAGDFIASVANGTVDLSGYHLPGDVNSDWIVDENDLYIISEGLANETCNDQCDANGDGVTDLEDTLYVASRMLTEAHSFHFFTPEGVSLGVNPINLSDQSFSVDLSSVNPVPEEIRIVVRDVNGSSSVASGLDDLNSEWHRMTEPEQSVAATAAGETENIEYGIEYIIDPIIDKYMVNLALNDGQPVEYFFNLAVAVTYTGIDLKPLAQGDNYVTLENAFNTNIVNKYFNPYTMCPSGDGGCIKIEIDDDYHWSANVGRIYGTSYPQISRYYRSYFDSYFHEPSGKQVSLGGMTTVLAIWEKAPSRPIKALLKDSKGNRVSSGTFKAERLGPRAPESGTIKNDIAVTTGNSDYNVVSDLLAGHYKFTFSGCGETDIILDEDFIFGFEGYSFDEAPVIPFDLDVDCELISVTEGTTQLENGGLYDFGVADGMKDLGFRINNISETPLTIASVELINGNDNFIITSNPAQEIIQPGLWTYVNLKWQATDGWELHPDCKLIVTVDHYEYEFTTRLSIEAGTCSSGAQTVNYNNGLEWQRCPKIGSHASAIDYCSNLIMAGHSDWRLPTKTELKSIVWCSNGKSTPLPEWQEFPGMTDEEEWEENYRRMTCTLDGTHTDYLVPTLDLDLFLWDFGSEWTSEISEDGRRGGLICLLDGNETADWRTYGYGVRCVR